MWTSRARFKGRLSCLSFLTLGKEEKHLPTQCRQGGSSGGSLGRGRGGGCKGWERRGSEHEVGTLPSARRRKEERGVAVLSLLWEK